MKSTHPGRLNGTVRKVTSSLIISMLGWDNLFGVVVHYCAQECIRTVASLCRETLFVIWRRRKIDMPLTSPLETNIPIAVAHNLPRGETNMAQATFFTGIGKEQ